MDTTQGIQDISKMEKMWNQFWPKAENFLVSFLVALIILFIGKKLIKLLMKIIDKAFQKSKLDKGVQSFLDSLIKFLLYAVLAVTIAAQLGIQTTSIVTLLGTAGLTVGLALQGSLSNFAGGVLILILKPFSIGDYIAFGSYEGTVTSINIFYTRLLTADNRGVVIPNGSLSNGTVVNMTKEPLRRLDLEIPVAYDSDLKKVRMVLKKTADEQKKLVNTMPVDILVSKFSDDAIVFTLRSWYKKEDVFVYQSELMEDIKDNFDREGIEIPFRQLVVHSSENKLQP